MTELALDVSDSRFLTEEASISPTFAGDPLKLRCPDCFKLYAIDPAEISHARPRFQCQGCSQRFWVPFPECLEQEEQIGLPLEWIEESENNAPGKSAVGEQISLKFACSQCEFENEMGSEECGRCGVVFAKLQIEPTRSLGAPRSVKDAWEAVIAKYDHEAVHQEFLRRSQKESSLDYASSKYASILEVNPNDDVALRMHSQIESLASIGVMGTAPTSPKRHLSKIGTVLVLLSLSLIISGFIWPNLRNLVGIGAAALFFTVAMKMQFFTGLKNR